MKRRTDFQGDSNLTARLRAYSGEFVRYNKMWGSLKNQEDFRLIYDLPDEIRLPLEEMYRQGGNLAISMICLFNDDMEGVSLCPTFAHFVSLVETSLRKHLEESVHVITKAEQTISNMDNCPWAVGEMIKLHKRQVKILKEGLVNWVHCAKNTKQYKEETGVKSKVNLPQSKSQVTLKDKIPSGTKWSDVEITFIDNEHVNIKVKNKKSEDITMSGVHYSQMGFKHATSSKKIKLWDTLRFFALTNGIIIPKYVNNGKLIKTVTTDDIKRLRKKLKSYSGISENPIPPYDKGSYIKKDDCSKEFVAGEGYKTKFSIRDDTALNK